MHCSRNFLFLNTVAVSQNCGYLCGSKIWTLLGITYAKVIHISMVIHFGFILLEE